MSSLKVEEWDTKLPIVELGSVSIDEILRLEKKLGQGQYGTVYEATDMRKVAVKEIKLQNPESQIPMLIQEIETLYYAKNCDKYTNELKDVLYDEKLKTFYFVMELIRGNELQDWVKQHPVQSDEDALKILIPLKEGLDCLHQQGIAHRDIKPQNVIVSETAIKWIDFGMSCIGECSHSVIGNLAHMAPELSMERRIRTIDEWIQADLWSFGCLAFELITGEILPFQMEMAKTYTLSEVFAQDIALTFNPLEYEIDFSLKERLEQFPQVMKLLQACLIVNPTLRKFEYNDFHFNNNKRLRESSDSSSSMSDWEDPRERRPHQRFRVYDDSSSRSSQRLSSA